MSIKINKDLLQIECFQCYSNVFNVEIMIRIRKMIVQNEINMQGELANKTYNRTVSYKHRTGRILVIPQER